MISLNGSLRTCKVNTGYANKLESERFENSDLMVCPVWNGHDLAGRPVCADSYPTKLAGCNVASDRVVVENNLRPSYAEYIQLDLDQGLQGPSYGSNDARVSASRQAKKMQENFPLQTGSFGGAGPNMSTIGEASCNRGYENNGMAKERYNMAQNAGSGKRVCGPGKKLVNGKCK